LKQTVTVYYNTKPRKVNYIDASQNLTRHNNSRAIAGKTERCRSKFPYASNFATASCGFSATARISCIGLGLRQRPFKGWNNRPTHTLIFTAVAQNHGGGRKSRHTTKIAVRKRH